MIRDVLNLAGFLLPQREEVLPSGSSASSSASSLCGGTRERSRPEISTDEKVKRAFYLSQRFADQVQSCSRLKRQGTTGKFPRPEVVSPDHDCVQVPTMIVLFIFKKS
uniref:Uncharacterized protein n=1 Tax=Hucho hucho TaxID=62062 RepID=A0A4W5LK05_9TELE